MADLSQLFAPQPTIQERQGRRNPFGLAAPQAAGFARKIAMREAMQQNLSPDSGDQFFQFVGNRLAELGDAEGALAVNQQRQQMMASQAQAQAAGQQQAFDNELKAARFGLDQAKFKREGSNQRTSRIATGAELGITDPDLQNVAIEVQEEGNRIVDFQVLGKAGTNVNVDVDARPPQVGGIEASKPTINKLQDQVLSSNESIGRLSQINATFDERFLQFGTRVQEFGGRIRDFMGRATPEDQQLITEFQDFKSTALDNLNLTLNQLSGAAVSPQEFKRISNALPNPGTSLFDGDSPTQFMSKTRRAMRDMKLARARANFVLSGGGSVDDIMNGRLSLAGMADIMQKKINEWDKAGFSKPQIEQKLRDNFGEF